MFLYYTEIIQIVLFFKNMEEEIEKTVVELITGLADYLYNYVESRINYEGLVDDLMEYSLSELCLVSRKNPIDFSQIFQKCFEFFENEEEAEHIAIILAEELKKLLESKYLDF